MTKWVTVDGGKFKVKPVSERERLQKLCDKAAASNDPVAMRADIKQVVNAVIKDWDEIEDRNGTPIPFNLNNAVDVFIEDTHLLAKIILSAGLAEGKA